MSENGDFSPTTVGVQISPSIPELAVVTDSGMGALSDNTYRTLTA